MVDYLDIIASNDLELGYYCKLNEIDEVYFLKDRQNEYPNVSM